MSNSIPPEMDALVLTAPKEFEIRRVPTPEPAPLEVLARVHSIAIDTGTDGKMIDGAFRETWNWPPYYPITIGHEWAGEVLVVLDVTVDTESHQRQVISLLNDS